MAEIIDVVKTIRSNSDKDSKAYKVTEYYTALTSGILDDGGVVLVRSKILSIEKHLIKWAKKHPNNGSTVMQPEEGAIILINDLRSRGFLK